MPIQIVKNPIPLTAADAVVQPVFSSKRGLFAPKAGSVTVTSAGSAGKYLFHVVCPEEYSETALRRGYGQCILQAKRKNITALVIPLLLPEKPDSCHKDALRLAIAALRENLEDLPLHIYLVVTEPKAMQMPASARQKLEQYLEQHSPAAANWSPAPFRFEESKYDTAAPAPFPMAPMPSMAPAPPMEAKKSRLKIPLETDAGFSETLLKLIDKTGKKDSEIYNKANVSRQHFSKIRNNPNYKPTKATAIAFAIALELDMEQTKDLIGRAGFALTRSSKFDLIIMYFIENKNFNLFDINEALYEFDQSLLGA